MAEQPVALVAGRDPLEGRGGHSSYVRAHARAARAAGFEPHVFCVGAAARVRETPIGVVHWVRVLDFGALRPFRDLRHRMPWQHLALARAVRDFAAASGARVLHGFGIFGDVALRAARALRARGLPAAAVVSVYDSLVRESEARLAGTAAERGRPARLPLLAEVGWTRAVMGPIERRMCEGADLLLANYESVRRILDELYGVGAQIQRVPYASETAFTRAGSVPPLPDAVADARRSGAPVLVCVARHDPRKGVSVLLHALARLRARGVAHRAILVGDGMQLAAHRRLAAALELGAITRITGWVEDAFAHVAHADVFALPSLEEGSGSMALLEALQAGVAVVASRVDGIPEDVVEGESALLVPPGDPDALASALARAFGDAALRARLGAGARAAFESRFSADRFSAALGERYAELLQRA